MEAQQIPVETFHPQIHRAAYHPANIQLVDPQGTSLQGRADIPPVTLYNRDHPTEAYAIIPNKPPMSLKHHGDNWGFVYFAVVYQHVSTTGTNAVTFRVPHPSQATYVAVKQLNKQVVQQQLQKGHRENPYAEIQRMQELGDDKHVLSCRNALETNEYLFIVTTRGERTLDRVIDWGQGPPDTDDTINVHEIYCHLMEILLYLRRHGICHRDFTPDNILQLPNQQWVVMDMAMSHRMTEGWYEPVGSFGTMAYMAPEIFMNRMNQPSLVDLWSATVILYNLQTSFPLYEMPIPGNLWFTFNILAKGLSSLPMNERCVDVYNGLPEGREKEALLQRMHQHLDFSPELMELFENVLNFRVEERWGLDEVMASDYIQNGE